MKLLIRHLRSTRGQALVEFALVLPIFAIMLFGIIDFGRYVFTANSLNNSAREAARFASVGNRPAGVRRAQPERLRQDVREEPRLGSPGELGVTVTSSASAIRPAASSPIPAPAQCRTDDFLVVHTKTTFTLVTPLIAQFLGNQTINGDSRVAVNQ